MLHKGTFNVRVADLESLAAAGKRVSVIYADPPWPWDTFGPLGRIRSCADHHFGLSTLDDIKKLPVANLAADDAALIVWGTWPRLPDVLEVITAWGFSYKTLAFVWVQQTPSGEGLRTGMGYYSKSNRLRRKRPQARKQIPDAREFALAGKQLALPQKR